MSSLYSLTAADLTPDPIPAQVYADLTDDDGDSVADVDVAAVIEAAEAEFNAHVGGMFTAAANIALARPLVKQVVVFRLHARRQSNAEYKIPEAVSMMYKSALAWADNSGKKLLAAEGTVTPAGAGGVKFEAPESTHGMEHLDRL